MKNLILITTDQQRFDSLGCNGNGFIKTPCLDKIASRGAGFKRAYCTNPVCTPSRVSIMTGLLPSRHGSYNIGTRAADTSGFLSTVLTRNGYRTHQIGKAHFYPWDEESPETRPVYSQEPFTDFAGFETAELSVGHSDWGVNGHYEAWLKERGICKGKKMPQLQTARLFENDAYQCGDWGMPVEYHSGAWILERAEKFLKERDRERPFYLNLGFQDPHHPLSVPEDWPKPLLEKIPLPEGAVHEEIGPQKALREGKIEEEYGGRFGIAGNQDTAWMAAGEEQIKKARQYYYAMVELYDMQIGQLFSLLEKYQVSKDTLVVITSDHGDMLYDHGLGEKGPMAYEQVLKVPLILWAPGEIAPQSVDCPVSLADLYPTILEYLDIPCPKNRDGISLKGLLTGKGLSRKVVRAEFKEEPDAVRYRCFITKDYKLVEYPGEAFGELYCLLNDPWENNNLYDDPGHLDVKYRILRAAMEEEEKNDFLAERNCRC